MGAYRRKLKIGIRWFYSGSYIGVKYHSFAKYESKKDCLDAERDHLQTLKNEQPSEILTLKEMFEARLDYLKLEKDRYYYQDNLRHANLMLDVWGKINANRVTKRMVNTLLMDELKRCKKKGISNGRANALLTNIKAFFNYGINRMDLEIRNPCRGIEKFKVDIHLKFVPSDELVNAVLEICTQEQKELLQFLDDTGARIGEALRLKSNDILDDHIVLYTRKSRNSSLTPRLIPKVDVPNKKGKIFRWVRRPDFLKYKVAKLKQPKWSYHSLRHRYAQRLALQNESTIRIMQFLGHSSINTTMIYLRSLGIFRD